MQSPANPKNTGVEGPTGYTAFFSCNSSLMTANSSITHVASAAYTPPGALPPMDVTITTVGNTLAITLLPDLAVPAGGKIVLWATAAVPTGNPSFKTRAYSKIGTLTGGIPLTGANIAAQYLSVFPAPPVGSKIGIKLMAVSDGGFTSNTLLTTGLTPTA